MTWFCIKTWGFKLSWGRVWLNRRLQKNYKKGLFASGFFLSVYRWYFIQSLLNLQKSRFSLSVQHCATVVGELTIHSFAVPYRKIISVVIYPALAHSWLLCCWISIDLGTAGPSDVLLRSVLIVPFSNLTAARLMVTRAANYFFLFDPGVYRRDEQSLDRWC